MVTTTQELSDTTTVTDDPRPIHFFDQDYVNPWAFFSTDLDSITHYLANTVGNGVLSGLDFSVTGSDLTVTIQTGEARVVSVIYTFTSTTAIDFTGDPASNPRKALIVIDSGGIIQKRLGGAEVASPSAEVRRNTFNPDPPEIDPGDIILHEVWLAASATQIVAADVSDRRQQAQKDLVLDNSSRILFGNDIILSRGAANRLDFATGDILSLDGDLQIGPDRQGPTDTGILKWATDRLGIFTFGDSSPIRIGGSLVELAKESGGAVNLSLGSTAELQFGGDVVLTRVSADFLRLKDRFEIERATSTTLAYGSRVTGQGSAMFQTDIAGLLAWGPGGGSATDTNLFRSAANILKTDDTLEIAGSPSIQTPSGVNLELDPGGTAIVAVNSILRSFSNNVHDLGTSGSKWKDLLLGGDVFADGTLRGQTAGGPGAVVRVGNDAELHDINIADSVGIRGLQAATNGRLYFGSANDTNIYRSGANKLKTDDDFIVGGNNIFGSAVRSKIQFSSVEDRIFLEGLTGGSTAAFVDFFRNTNTTGTRNVRVFQGDGTGTITMTLHAATGRIALPIAGGGAGLLLGGDVLLFRDAANRLDLASGDTLRLLGDRLEFGADIVLRRVSADFLRLEDRFEVEQGATTNVAFGTRVTGQGNSMFFQRISGEMNWGPGGASATDIQLFRGAANRLDLASGDSFRIVSGQLDFGADVILVRGSANRLELASGDSLKIVSGGLGVGVTEAVVGRVSATTLLLGNDVLLSRGAANRLDLASGDNFKIVTGKLGINKTATMFLDIDTVDANDAARIGGSGSGPRLRLNDTGGSLGTLFEADGDMDHRQNILMAANKTVDGVDVSELEDTYIFIEHWNYSTLPGDGQWTAVGAGGSDGPSAPGSLSRERGWNITTGAFTDDTRKIETQQLINSDGDFIFETAHRISSTSATEFEFGLMNTIDSDVPTGTNREKACFRRTGSGNIFAVTGNGTSETTTDTGIAVSTTARSFRIEHVGSDIKFFIEGVLEATHSTNLPTNASLRVFNLVQTTSTLARTTSMYGVYLRRKRANP